MLVLLKLSLEATHEIAGTKAAIKIINKKKMVAAKMCSKVKKKQTCFFIFCLFILNNSDKTRNPFTKILLTS